MAAAEKRLRGKRLWSTTQGGKIQPSTKVRQCTRFPNALSEDIVRARNSFHKTFALEAEFLQLSLTLRRISHDQRIHFMRKIALLCFLLLCILQLRAQRPAISVGWEPAFQGFGVSLDNRVAPNSHWGYRAGVGYTRYNKIEQHNYREKGITFPLELNFLAGGKHHKFEAALGTTLAYMWYTYDEHQYQTNSHGCYYFTEHKTQHTQKYAKYSLGRFTQLCYLSAGYRFQLENGLLVRVGLSTFDDLHEVFYFSDEDDHLRPYLSIGYTF